MSVVSVGKQIDLKMLENKTSTSDCLPKLPWPFSNERKVVFKGLFSAIQEKKMYLFTQS
jgi:hypothetical protein